MKESNRQAFRRGFRDGIPIGLGYLAVSFSIGIAARNIGLNAFQGFLMSLLNNASAGEYAGLTVIAANSPYIEVAIVTLITNARYLLMSCAMSQRLSPDLSLGHRLLMSYDITDELFGIAISRPGTLNPYYTYGAMVTPLPGWAFGTMLGVIAGNIMSPRMVSAFSVALFGMFIAIIIPPSKQNKVVAGLVTLAFSCIYLKLRSNLPTLDLHSVGWYQNNHTDRRTFSRSSILLPDTDRRRNFSFN